MSNNFEPQKPWPKNTIALICCRVGDPYWNRREGSEERNCYNCGHEIMAAPDSLQNKSIMSSEFVCVECYSEYTNGKPHLLLRPLESHTKPQMSTPLVFDNKQLAYLKQFAEQNRLPIDECWKIMEGKALVPGERPGYTIFLEPCWKLVFSISEYPRKTEGTVWVRHMSMSLEKPGRVPNLIAIRLITEQLGFPALEECHVSCENNIVEVMSEMEDITDDGRS
jgi:hypothetical protein